MRRAAWTLLLLFLAGCIAPEPAPVPGPPPTTPEVSAAFAKIATELRDLPCNITNVPRDTTSGNLRSIADLAVEAPLTPRTMGESDRRGDRLVQAFYTDEGFRLLNISDPAEPRQVGQYFVSAGSDTYDVKFSRQQDLVLVGFSNRIHLVDVSAPGQPKLLHELRHPAEYRGQAHMMYPHVVNGTEFVFTAPSISGTGLMVNKIVGTGAQARLELVRVYTSTGPHALYPQALAPHDTFAVFDETAGHHLLYLANSFNGIVILQIDDPANAQTVASLPPAQAPPPTGALPNHYHTIQSAWILGKRILVTVSEVGYNTMKVFDATDLRNVRFLGEWVHDRNQAAKMQHNFQIVNGTLIMGHYEHGAYLFHLPDFVAAPGTGLRPVAHYQPPPGGLIWDIIVWDGLLFFTDVPQGLHVVGYGCFRPGDPALTSVG